jgi:hypothetical protein
MPFGTNDEIIDSVVTKSKMFGTNDKSFGINDEIIDVGKSSGMTSEDEKYLKRNPIIETIYPRLTEYSKSGSGEKMKPGRALLSSALDLVSLPLRGTVGAVETAAELAGHKAGGGKIKDFKLGESLAKNIGTYRGTSSQGKAERIAETIAKDPAMLIPGAGAAKVGLLSKMALEGLRGAGSAAVHQGEKVARGQKASGSEAAAETILSAALPGVSDATKSFLRGASNRIMSTAVKATGKNRGAVDYNKAFEEGASPMAVRESLKNFARKEGEKLDVSVTGDALKNMDAQLNAKFSDLEKKLQKTVRESGLKNNEVELDYLLGSVEKSLKNNRMLTANRDEINAAFKKMKDNIKSDYPGQFVNPEDALMLKRSIGKNGNWEKAVKKGEMTSKNNPNINPDQLVHNEMYQGLNKLLEKITDPAYKEINKKFSELIPVESAIRNRIKQKTNNEILSLSDLGFGAGAGIAQSIASGGISTSALLPAAVGIAVNRSLRSPRVAYGSYLASKQLKPSKTTDVGTQLLRSSLFSKKEEKKK